MGGLDEILSSQSETTTRQKILKSLRLGLKGGCRLWPGVLVAPGPHLGAVAGTAGSL
ncbi:hypothetical protein vBSenSEnJE1_9 [Salmonella phage vB_SenS-EnJE1]|uniref:Uncharacterized protein n=3 Tax=Jerseyvirus TaxID=1910991 RepID=A0A649V0M8_9CAUD|nr:hypothetical protein QA023_gp01 [Salmonella phage wast]YP_010746781.1 hypothetical protein QA036_gp09 [Salmonella phage vB_SenS-EnJE1]YP_010748202.1 hypothetical protein QA058_gp46 [Salmonella phage GRNsp50]QGJ84374.1 hypothetical protein vBSenSEnJE1_9 [Salmonella phage vB_SenS-EnJE1]QIN99561.1 hypothetical protein wast_1 [Salmonella phage wast]USW07644.1 hypothetical protein [Salmonella phage GRNsp50]